MARRVDLSDPLRWRFFMSKMPYKVGIIGTGFVADLYMRSISKMPDITVVSAFDRNADRLTVFCDYWGVARAESREALIASVDVPGLMLNLTNPSSHYEVSHALLDAGHHVYSEKPLATKIEQARELVSFARERGLQLASAPCSVLSEVAQTVWKAVRNGEIKNPRLVYAELDDDFIPCAPYGRWRSETGAPWPWDDEFRVGCTLEHAGYYLSWLMAMFGRIRTVSAASANLVGDLLDTSEPAPDFSVAVLFFESGVVARLTCSIVAPHDHSLQIIGDNGVLSIDECWDNIAHVRLRKRFRVRRRLINSPFSKRLRLGGKTHPKVGRRGAAAMNFALGPAEMLDAIDKGRPARLGAQFALHLTEVTLAIQEAGETGGSVAIQSDCPEMLPMDWAK